MLALLVASLVATTAPYADADRDEQRIEDLLSQNAKVTARTQHATIIEEQRRAAEAAAREAEFEARSRQYNYAELQNLIGRNVRLFADQSTQVEGVILKVDISGVTLNHGRRGDSATFFIARDRVRYARLIP